MSRGDLSEVEWRILRVLLPVEREPGKRGRGRPPEDNRNIINGILWRLRTGAPWRDVPEKYGNWNSIYRRFRRWSASGVWESVAVALAETMAESGQGSNFSTRPRPCTHTFPMSAMRAPMPTKKRQCWMSEKGPQADFEITVRSASDALQSSAPILPASAHAR